MYSNVLKYLFRKLINNKRNGSFKQLNMFDITASQEVEGS